MNSTIKDVMSTHVIAVRQGAPYKEMAAMMHDQRVSAFPVIDDGNKVTGVVSEADLLTKAALEGTVPRTLLSRNERVRKQTNAVTAADLMTKPPVTIGPDEPVTHAARLMYNRRVKRLPVTSDDGTLIEGTPETNRVGHDVIDAVRHMEGVVFVRDRLSYPDDSSRHPRIAT